MAEFTCIGWSLSMTEFMCIEWRLSLTEFICIEWNVNFIKLRVETKLDRIYLTRVEI